MSLLKDNLEPELFQKYDRFITKAFFETQDLTPCPKCNEWYVDIGGEALLQEAVWKSILCYVCGHRFCGSCGQQPHKGQLDQDVTCAQYAAWIKDNQNGGDDSLNTYIQDQKLFPCPQCRMIGERAEGCKFLYCRCRAAYCALCGVGLTQAQHYTHFQGMSKCTGPFGEHCRGVADGNVSSKSSSSSSKQKK